MELFGENVENKELWKTTAQFNKHFSETMFP